MYEILLARTGVRKIYSVACRFSPIKLYFSDYPKSLISRINEVYVFFNEISLYSDILLKSTQTFIEKYINFIYNRLHCVGMVSVTSASRYVHPRYDSTEFHGIGLSSSG